MAADPGLTKTDYPVAQSQRLTSIAPVLTFQSVIDSTVSTRAVVDSLYRYLPDNGSELVIFDINQAANLRALFRPATYSAVNTLLPPAPRPYSTTIVTNATQHTLDTVARLTLAGQTAERTRALHLSRRRICTHFRISRCRSPSLIRCMAASRRRKTLAVLVLAPFRYAARPRR